MRGREGRWRPGSVDDQVAAKRPFLWMSMNGEDWNGISKEYERKVRIMMSSEIQFLTLEKMHTKVCFSIAWS